jgi:ribosomal protein S3
MFKRIMRYFFKYEKPPNFYGIKVEVRGKFHGILRKRKFKINMGRTGINKLNIFIDYDLRRSFTRFGVFSTKVWLTYFDNVF